MKEKIILFTLFLLVVISAKTQQNIELYNLNSYNNFNATVNSLGTYRNISVNVNNGTSSSKNINVSCGTFFENNRTSEQSLVVLFKETEYLSSRGSKNIKLTTACMDASKSVPSNHSNWKIKNDKGLGDLIRFYHLNRPMIGMMTDPNLHSTKEKQINFLQMAVWAYYDCDKNKIIDFSTKYMFDGDRQAAEEFVNLTIPMIKTFIAYYKASNR